MKEVPNKWEFNSRWVGSSWREAAPSGSEMKGSRELECADCAGQRFRVVLQTASEKSFVTLGSDLGSLEVETRRGSAPGHPRI